MEDRTDEFLNLARSVPVTTARPAKSKPGQESSLSASSSGNPHRELRAFHQTAGQISRDIASTSALLTELTNMVRHHSPLDDDTDKINHLVVRIKASIENLNSRLDQAGKSIAQQKRTLGQQAGQEASNLVDGLKTEFAEAATGFKEVLQQRTNTMKENDDMKQQVYGLSDDSIPNISLAPPPVFGTQGSMGSFPTLDLTSGMMEAGQDTSSSSATGLPRPHGIVGNDYGMRRRPGHDGIPSFSGSYSTYEDSGKPLTPLDIQRMDEETGAAQMMQLIPDQDYLQQRADAMSTVESNIVELGTIFNKLAGLVSEHREMVQRVEDNVEDANTNINLSLNTLTDTLTNLQTNRALALRVFSVLVLFIIMFIIFAA